MSLSALPDPNEVNYDLLLSCVYQTCCPDYHLFKRSSSRVLTYLNLYGMIIWSNSHYSAAHANEAVESDYTVVLFAAGGGHTPPRNWMWKAYRGLSRKYRKNLKQLVSLSAQNWLRSTFDTCLSTSYIHPFLLRVRLV